MAVIFVDGFTGVTRKNTGVFSSTTLGPLGYASVGYYGVGVIPEGTAAAGSFAIEADPTFASRNILRMYRQYTGNTNLVLQAIQEMDTSGFQKYVVGFMMRLDTADTSSTETYIGVGVKARFVSSSYSTSSDNLIQFGVRGDPNANGTIYATRTGGSTSSSVVKKGQDIHVELLIEDDAKRCRVYLNGVLAYDYTLNVAYGSTAGGLSFHMMTSGTALKTLTISNVYLLGLDTVHTGILGPATRVLEVPPTADASVQWDRPDTFQSNAAVMQQYFDNASASYLTAGDVGATDLYVGPNAVAANAVQVYGAAFKVNASSMVEGVHQLVGSSASGGVAGDSTRPVTLNFAVAKPVVLDVSVNPKTNQAWKPAEISAASIGFKLFK